MFHVFFIRNSILHVCIIQFYFKDEAKLLWVNPKRYMVL